MVRDTLIFLIIFRSLGFYRYAILIFRLVLGFGVSYMENYLVCLMWVQLINIKLKKKNIYLIV